jgi:hypothetical protein
MRVAILAAGIVAGASAGVAARAQPTAPMAEHPPARPAPSPPPAGRAFLYQGEATSILGRRVQDPAGGPVGRIVDVLVDGEGSPRAAVIDFGGFLGVGNRRVAVAWHALRFDAASGSVTLGMTVDQIRAIPAFRQPDRPADPPATVAVPPAPPLSAPPAPPAPGP